MTAEERRLEESRRHEAHWKRWGPYLSERAWGTVREDYSEHGTAWDYLPHDHARSRAYRWNEDGIAGVSDRHQLLCFALALWNGKDPILKERMFGLTGSEGNHGEDPKELYYYLDSTPTHSYMRMLYKYPQRAFPYAELVAENQRRSRKDLEYELWDTGAFEGDRYFDVFVEYAKASPDDLLVRIEAVNRGPDPAPLELLPTLWFRNTWSWNGERQRPSVRAEPGTARVRARHAALGEYVLHCEGAPELLFTENDTNVSRLFGAPNGVHHVKDAFHAYVVDGRREAVNPDRVGTKCAARYRALVPAGGAAVVKLRLRRGGLDDGSEVGRDFDAVLAARRREADEFYEAVAPSGLSADERHVLRQSLAGMLWSKQFYHYVVRDWLAGDPAQPKPAEARARGRNADWPHLYNADVLSMPDKWEYPWFAAWDLAFHCVPLALVDADFAKEQLLLLLREWYMHPNGQIPAYEWAFGDVNPPVLAWAALKVHDLERRRTGRGDRAFLKRVFHKLMLNFTWWVNRKDAEGKNVFQGGFLGLDNIGVFDRSAPLPTGGHLEQSDGTSWMAMYSLNLLSIALELACEEPEYEDVASKFWEHFVHIARAMNTMGLWDEGDGFYYDLLHTPAGEEIPLRVRSLVGLIPLFAVESFPSGLLEKFPAFLRRLEWFIDHRMDLTEGVACMRTRGEEDRRLFSVVSPDRLRKLLRVMLDESEFLSDYGVRSVSAVHRDRPFELPVDGMVHRVRYEPAESSSGLFGGNSNWRGPIWFPTNFLLIESLRKFHRYLGDGFRVELPAGSGRMATLGEVADELANRLSRIFLRDARGRRPCFGGTRLLQEDPHFRDHLLFHEYFHGDDGAGIGANHQTGWTGLVAALIAKAA
ncbi:MGH1-like glycoside hydrolase domain-containing protein [Anaeromyxobacter oryzae]|uniref:Glucosidase n=1 Tax=Anaeromyxobacter oryzae TaxID=2918170 RepID=A0ABN6MYN1_9BACT|nr:glucosidase [Anaeromyxobacter oryzae]BDG06072.1 glucosidase [Anaeromyxobacter oryzae]